jgi:signal transduction histidine kinase/CheY-like chemotaxis protein
LARENGRWIWVNEQRLPDGGVITVATDITARKKAEEEIRALNAELEGRVEERTRELTDELGVRRRVESELPLAKDAAEAGNQAKSQFLSMMSHELRTPLNAVLGFGQLLEQDPSQSLDESHRQCVAEILKAGQHLLKLISDILDFAQLEGRKIAISPRDIDPRPEIESCLTLLRPDAVARGIEIVNRSVGRDLPGVFVDPTRFKQALLNLLSNAIKYNREGGTVLLDAAVTADGMLRVSVADTGPGISEQDRERLFEPFNRLNVNATDVEGTGIGLSITKQLVVLMHGRVGCESEEGRGSTFWLDLPLSPAKAGGRDQPAPSRPETPHGHESTESRTVLYVEDDPANRRLMESVMGVQSDLALACRETAEEALEFVSATPPDVILMDIGLPGMSGHEALAELRSNGRTRDIPVIAVSAYAMPDDIDRGLEWGFDAYVTKPIHVGDLLKAIEAALDAAPRHAT